MRKSINVLAPGVFDCLCLQNSTRLVEVVGFEAMAENTGEKDKEVYNYRERIKCSPEEEARLERQHFWKVIDAFRYYRYCRLL